MKTSMSRNATGLVLLMLAATLVVGCSDSGTEDKPAVATETETGAETTVTTALTAAEEAMVAQAAAIAVAVEKAPAMAEAILKEKGVTPEEYEAMVYKIAASASLSEAFEKAKAGL